MADVVQRRDKLIPWYFVMFFVFLAIVDGTFVTIATSTHRGLVTDNAYEKGLNYNETISAYDAQKNLNWDSTLHYEQPLLTFALKDEQGMTRLHFRRQILYKD
ncbi:MAG: FixH family protein [Rickettsiales bacterium]|nr:FixH family protein [Rickettsiales bacterium]